MKPVHLGRSATEKLIELDRILELSYGAPEAQLGNQQDPLDEAIYIILSSQTNLARFRSIWDRLRATFPTWDDIEHQPEDNLAAVLREGGLQRQKARTIKRLLSEVRRRTGRLSLDHVSRMPDDVAEAYLLSLPGFSWKTARCVLLYSLVRNVFPIDVNTFRILKRVGILPSDAKYRRKSLHNALQEAVPPERRRRFHVDLVVHGQRTCVPVRPKCPVCPVRPVCQMVGVLEAIRRLARDCGSLGERSIDRVS